jgi:hypothetical protein
VTKPKDNARGTHNPPLGVPPSLEFQPLDRLQVDAEYQRSLSNDNSLRLIRKIAQAWDWRLCQPLVIARRSNGDLMVVDGQHRLAAARLRDDIPHLPCVIVSYADAGDEAAAFVALNQQRRALQPIEIFKAALVAGDPDAQAVTRILKQAGLGLAPHTNWRFWKARQLANVGALLSVYRNRGERVLLASLRSMAIAFDGFVLQYAGTLFGGISLLVAEQFSQGVDKAEFEPLLTKTLASKDQGEWVRLARLKHAEALGTLAVAMCAVLRAEIDQPTLDKVVSIAPAPTDMLPAEKAWCQQCDASVSGAIVARCRSPFCKLKKDQAA